MQVLHVISGLDPASGGPAQAVVGLARAQRAQGASVEVVASNRDQSDSTYMDQLERADVHVVSVEPCRGSLRTHPQLKQRVQECVSRADVVHIHGLWEQVQHDAAVISRKLSKPYIFRPCGMLDPWSLAQSRLKKRIYMAWRLRRNLNNARILHFTSSTERELTAPLRLRPQSIVEANGLDLSEFDALPPQGSFRSQYPQLAGRPFLLFLSRLHRKKGLDILIPSLSRIANRDAVLVLAGPDDRGYRAEVQRMIEHEGLADRVILTGMLKGEQKVAALADADLFVLPSYQENFGIAVVESLAARTPVVISDQVNIHQAISAAGVGGVVPTDIDALVVEIDRWLADEAMRGEAASHARRFVDQRYDWNIIAANWLKRYNALHAGAIPDDASN